jgi:acetate kinase
VAAGGARADRWHWFLTALRDHIASLLSRVAPEIARGRVVDAKRDLLASGDPEARLLVEYFVRRAAKEIGALAAVLGGIDGLVFTAGSARTRSTSASASAARTRRIDRAEGGRGARGARVASSQAEGSRAVGCCSGERLRP